MLTARGRPEDVLKGFAAGRRRLPAEADGAGDSARAHRGPAAAFAAAGRAAPHDQLQLRGQDHRLRRAGAARRRSHAAADADGGEPAAIPGRRTKARRSRARRCSKTSGACAKTPTRARSTISSSGCAATSKKEPGRPTHLLTVRGVGYRFIAEPASVGAIPTSDSPCSSVGLRRS